MLFYCLVKKYISFLENFPAAWESIYQEHNGVRGVDNG